MDLCQWDSDVRARTNQGVIQKIENGKVWNPPVVAELASALGVNPAWLQWGEPFAEMRIASKVGS